MFGDDNSEWNAHGTMGEISSTVKQEKNKGKNFFRWTALVLIFALVFGFSVGSGIEFSRNMFSGLNKPYIDTESQVIDEKAVATTNQTNYDVVGIVEKVSPSIVSIANKVMVKDFFNNTAYQDGAGSGVVFKVDTDYIYILTNNHVVTGSSSLMVEFNGGSKADGEIVGKDSLTDLAVVKVKTSAISKEGRLKIKPALLGNSDQLKVGEMAVALGNPLAYGMSVTSGVISAINRTIEDQGIDKMIQTDAAINPGNSGGALVNSKGEVIGINTIKIAETSVEGIGFSIPINSAKPIIDQLFSKGYVSRPYLGIYGNVIDSEVAAYYNLPMGVMISDTIAGSGAAKAGLKKGDIIIAVGGTKINTMADLSKVLEQKKVGDHVVVKIIRETKPLEIKVTLTERGKE